MINQPNQTRDKAKSEYNDITDKANKKVVELGEDISGAAHRAGEKVRHFLESAKDEVTDASKAVTNQIRNKPVQSSVIAFAAGFILAALFRR